MLTGYPLTNLKIFSICNPRKPYNDLIILNISFILFYLLWSYFP